MQGKESKLPEIEGYELIQQIGEGAAGKVYLGFNRYLGEVKIKVFKEPTSKVREAMVREDLTLDQYLDKTLRNRFVRFDKVVRDKTNISQLYGHGQCLNPDTGEPTFYLVSDFVDAGAMEEKTSEGYHVRDDVFQSADIIMLMSNILAGLENIHKAGLILKDIKLSNILLSRDHQTLLIDDLETIAMIEDNEAGETSIEGSDRYAAPEVIRDIKDASPQSDIYSAGVCLYYMLTGDTTAFVEINRLDDEVEYDRQLDQMMPRIEASIGQRKSAVLRKALSFRPEDRYRSALEFSCNLQNADAWVYDVSPV